MRQVSHAADRAAAVGSLSPKMPSVWLGIGADAHAAVIAWIYGISVDTVWRDIFPTVGLDGWWDYMALADEVVIRLQQLRRGEIQSIALPEKHPVRGEYFSLKYHCPRYLLLPEQLYPDA